MKKKEILLMAVFAILSFIIFTLIFQNWELVKGWFI